MDPLSILRDYTIHRRIAEVSLTETECVFGSDYRFPRGMETAYRRRDGGRYTLEALVVLVKNLDAKHADYIRQARSANVPLVTFTDRKTVQEYLEGKITGSDAIELVAPLAIPSAPAAATAAVPSGAAAAQQPQLGGAPSSSDRNQSDGRASKRFRGEGAEPGGGPVDGDDTAGGRRWGIIGPGAGLGSGPDAITVEGGALGYDEDGDHGGMSRRDPVVEMVLKTERPLRDSVECLMCPKRPDLFLGVLAMVDKWEKEQKQIEADKKREAKRKEQMQQARKDGHRRDRPSIAAPAAHGDGDKAGAGGGGVGGAGGGPTTGNGGGSTRGRSDERQFWKEYMGTDAPEALGIDPTQSYMHPAPEPASDPAGGAAASRPRSSRWDAGAPPGTTAPGQLPALPPPPPGLPPPPPPPHPGSSSPSSKPQHHSHSLTPHRQHGSGSSSHHQHRPSSSSRAGSGSSSRGGDGGGAGGGLPIILVPSATQTLINMYNVKEFLEDCAFVSPEEKMKKGGQRPEVVTVQRSVGRSSPVKYEVRDKVTGLSKRDWERVVAVFVLGKEWQFKGWPFGDLVETLSKVMGVFVRYEDDSIESAAAVKQWNCQILTLSKYKRHTDRTAVLSFWTKLDNFLRSRKSSLVF